MAEQKTHDQPQPATPLRDFFSGITRRAIRNLEQQGNEFANASRYETRLHRMYYRALNKLQELLDRRAAGKPIGHTVLSDPLPDPPADFPNELEAPPDEEAVAAADENENYETNSLTPAAAILPNELPGAQTSHSSVQVVQVHDLLR